MLPVIWRAIRILEAIGLEVFAVVCDGATPNRRFFRTYAIENGLNLSEEGVVYWVTNRYDLSRKIFFVDPPHLIKTIRNNFENSGGHNYTRNLMVSDTFFSLIHHRSAQEILICSNYHYISNISLFDICLCLS